MVDVGTFFLIGIGLIFYLAIPIWGGVRASRNGHPGWSAISFLSILVGLGPIVGILALTACAEPLIRINPKTLGINGVDYYIERVLFRKSIGIHSKGSYFVVLFTAENVSNDDRTVAVENWKLQKDEMFYAPEWSLSTAAVQAFSGRTYHSSLNPGMKQSMIAAFELSRDVYSDIVKSKTGLAILIPNIKDGVDERIEVKLQR